MYYTWVVHAVIHEEDEQCNDSILFEHPEVSNCFLPLLTPTVSWLTCTL